MFKAELKLEVVPSSELRRLRRQARWGWVGAVAAVLGVAVASVSVGRVTAYQQAMVRVEANSETNRQVVKHLEKAWKQQNDNIVFIQDFAANLKERDEIRTLNVAQRPIPHPTTRSKE